MNKPKELHFGDQATHDYFLYLEQRERESMKKFCDLFQNLSYEMHGSPQVFFPLLELHSEFQGLLK